MHLLTQSALLRALGWSLFNSLWQMSLLWAFYHLFLLVFKQLPARARHGLALVLLAAGFCWSAITFVNPYLFTAGQPLEGPGAFPGNLAGTSLWSAHGFQTILDAGRGLAGQVLPWCSSLYLLIVAGLLVHYSRQYIRSRRLVREGLTPLAPEFDTFVSAAGNRMGIRAHVSAYLSSLVRVPVTLGLLKPVILLPVAMVTQLTTAQIEAILVHELAHIRRKDYLLNLLITAMELLFFFNPFTRLLIGQLKNEREHCCDDAVLECRYDPHGYVSALLSLARQQQPTGIALAAIGGGGEQLLLQRARKILQQKRSDDRPGPRPLIGLLLTALFSVLLLGHVRPVHTARIQAQTHPPLPAPRQYPAFRPETMSFVIINTPAIGAAPTFPRTTANARARMIPSAKMTPRTSTSPQAKSAPRTLAAPPSAAAASLAAQTHRHPAHPHPKRPSQDMLEAMLAESVPVLNTAGPMTMPAFTDLMETASRADRDFSIGRSTTTTQDDPDPMADNMPFVPQSSFSFQYTDTLPPGEKLALMQELSQKSLHLQIARIEAELKQQQSLLHRQEAAIRRASAEEFRSGLGNTLDTRSLQQLLQQQLQVQRQYILNLQKLQRQLKKASRHLTIVYI